jgi:hypothetical protein
MCMCTTLCRSLMATLREVLGSTCLVELVGTISAYNGVSRFLVALDVGVEEEEEAGTVARVAEEGTSRAGQAVGHGVAGVVEGPGTPALGPGAGASGVGAGSGCSAAEP